MKQRDCFLNSQKEKEEKRDARKPCASSYIPFSKEGEREVSGPFRCTWTFIPPSEGRGRKEKKKKKKERPSRSSYSFFYDG